MTPPLSKPALGSFSAAGLARYENAITGEKYPRLNDIPFAGLTELLTYPSAEAEAGWDADSQESAENSMLYIIVGEEDITVVLDNPHTAEMRSILEAIHGLLWTDIQYTYARAA